ncbi:MAG: DUF4358 domain-containing protein [Lachnospiraceae bacterium]|nr:DUF4358 domain-containing protein [Lachnospiraceae bacterium]
MILAAIAAFVIYLVLSQRQANLPFSDVSAQVEQAIDQELLRDAGTKGLSRYYGLNSSDYEGVLLYQSVSGMSADEVLLIKVKNREQMERVTEAVEARRESRINDFTGYAPEEAAVMEAGELIIRGNFCLFLPCSEAAVIKEAFLQALGD